MSARHRRRRPSASPRRPARACCATGGNAVDAAVAAMLTSWVAEPLLTGPGAGGYLLVAGAGEEPTLLDFFVAAPGRGADTARRGRAACRSTSTSATRSRSSTSAPASCGVPGQPGRRSPRPRGAGGPIPLAELAAPAAALAREGVPVNAPQAYIVRRSSRGILAVDARGARRSSRPGGARCCARATSSAAPELGDAIERLGARGRRAVLRRRPRRSARRVGRRARRARSPPRTCGAYEPVAREPVRARYRGRDVLTNPPPNAGGVLLAHRARAPRRAGDGPPRAAPRSSTAMRRRAGRAHARVHHRPGRPGVRPAASSPRASASTTHIAVHGRRAAARRRSRARTARAPALVVPGTGIHVNNIMGEEDLSPLGFHRAAPGTRMPSMMAPTVVLRDGEVELVLGSAGSNRIRSAILQTIVGVVDHGLRRAARRSRRRARTSRTASSTPSRACRSRSCGGRPRGRRASATATCSSAACRRSSATSRTGALTGAGDPRRGGVAVDGVRRAPRRRRARRAASLAGCGTPSADLFVVERTGDLPDAELDLLVGDGGAVECDGDRARRSPATGCSRRASWPTTSRRCSTRRPAPAAPARRSLLRFRVIGEGGRGRGSPTPRRGLPPELARVIALHAARWPREACGLDALSTAALMPALTNRRGSRARRAATVDPR